MGKLLNCVKIFVFFIIVLLSRSAVSQTAYLITPSNGSTEVPIPTLFTWSGSGMEYYWLQVDDDPDFGSPAIDDDHIMTMQYSANSLQQNTTYYWRINGHIYDTWGGFWRGFTATWSFTSECPRPGPPNLLEPLNGDTDIVLPVYFDWEDIFSVLEYEIQIDDNSDFSSIEEAFYSSVSEYTSSNLNQDTYYFWRIRARFNNSCGWGNWGTTWGFSTECPIPNQLSLIYPANNEVDISAPLLLDWSDEPLAEQYHIMLDDDPYYNSPEIDYEFNSYYSDYTVATLEINTIYYWKVLAYNSCGDANWSQSRRFSTACPVSDPPVQSAPADGTSGLTLPMQISWGDNPDNISYRLQIDDELEFGAPIFDYLLGQTTSYNVSSYLKNGRTYYWRVRAENNCGWSNWSSVWEFSLDCPTVTVPVLVAPENGSTDGYLPVILDWDDVPNASTYHILIDNNPAFSSVEIEYDFPAGPSNFYPIGIGESVIYYWKVKASNSCFESDWSQVRSFSGKNIPKCGDVNNDGLVNILDVVYTINFLYKQGYPPCEPPEVTK